MCISNVKKMPAKKKVGSVHTAKNGAKYKIMANGKARFISGPTRGRGAKRKTAAKKGGSLSSIARGVVRGAKSFASGYATIASAPLRQAVRDGRKAVGGGVRVAGGVQVAGGLKKRRRRRKK